MNHFGWLNCLFQWSYLAAHQSFGPTGHSAVIYHECTWASGIDATRVWVSVCNSGSHWCIVNTKSPHTSSIFSMIYLGFSHFFTSFSELTFIVLSNVSILSLQVIVPLPSWDWTTKQPLTSDPEKYAIEKELIFKYSPFKNEQQLMEQFNKIESSSGKHMTVTP